MYRYGTIAESELRRILLETRSSRLDGAVYCESNQTLSLIIPILSKVFPQAGFIWLMRNGLDMVASAMQKQWYTGHSEHHDRYEDCPPLQKAWIDGRIEGDHCGDMSAVEWSKLDRFGRCCWYWSYVNRVIEADLKKYAAGSFKLLLLEDLDLKLSELIQWMGLKVAIVPKAKRHNTAMREPYHWTMWTANERATFEHWCGSLMDRFYPTWRIHGGEWKGVEYRTRSGLFARISSNYKFVKRVNASLARNRIS